jgi:RNA polymerase sigma factor (sigma-70 family)
MATGQLSPVIQYLRKVSALGNAADLTDSQLLERFTRHREEAAFATILRRHGPVVLSVCERVLHDRHDVEDAFQATFLLLLRKASSLRQPELLGAWLYGVAYRTALRAKADAARRRLHERAAAAQRMALPSEDPVWRDLRPVLDDAINRLPVKYRLPFVLCYLEGKTHAQAAQQLGCPEGTIATRLSRARQRLRTHLTRRGLALSTGLLATTLAHHASATVPAALVHATLRAALAYASDPLMSAGVLSAKVITLTEGVLRAMFLSKLKTFLAVVLLIGAAGTGAALLTNQTPAAEPARKQHETEPPAVEALAPAPRVDSPQSPSPYRTANFLVEAPTASIAKRIGEAAEHHRKEQALLWLGKEMPNWPEPCPLRVKVTVAGTGGATSFQYRDGKVVGQNMHLEGPLDRLLASALPHEVTHAVLAHSFGRPLPRWADEGGALLAEDEQEQRRHDKVLQEIVDSGRAIPLRRLLALQDFPEDVMAFYAESYSVTRFLVDASDRQTFLAFVAQGSRDGWDRAVKTHYGYSNVEELERAWKGHLPNARPEQVNQGQRWPQDMSVFINERNFCIPINTDSSRRGDLECLRLFVSSDKGKTWKLVDEITPERKSFTFTAPADGIYWFTVESVAKNGTKSPEDLRAASVQLKVMVDTSAPSELRKAADPKPTGRTRETCAISVHPPLPREPMPVQALVSMNKGRLIVRRTAAAYKPVQGTDREGQKITFYEPVITTTTEAFHPDRVEVYDTKGKSVNPNMLPGLLNEEILALVYPRGQKYDPLHLRVVKEGTLIFVLPPSDSSVIPPPRVLEKRTQHP